jgi:DNA repair protein RadC
LTSRNKLIEYAELFQGTIDATSVYPREVVKLALHHNAAAVIIAHNHPPGSAEPSRADIQLTATLKAALDLVGTRMLDHVIVCGANSVSMAELGLV